MSHSKRPSHEQRSFLGNEQRSTTSNRVRVAPALIRWAVDRYGNREELERRFPQLSGWIQGTAEPTVRQLEAFARVTLTPFGYFFLPEPPRDEIAIPDFRVRSGGPVRLSAKMQALIGMLQVRQEWLSEYRQSTGWSRLSFLSKYDTQADPEEVASDMRAELGLPSEWPSGASTREDALATLIRYAEATGIVVVFNSVLSNNTHQKLKDEDFSGFVLVDAYAPFIFINTGRERTKAAQLFTLAHELAHLWLGETGISRVPPEAQAEQEVERSCNRIAAAFLMPARSFSVSWATAQHEPLPQRISRLAQQWKASQPAIVIRAMELNLLDRSRGDPLLGELRRGYEEREEKATYAGGDFYRTQMRRLGRPFVDAVLEALEEEVLSHHEAQELLDMRGKTFNRLLDRIRGG